MSDSSETLYDRIGGAARVSQLVGGMYERILADPELAPFFENSSMDKLRSMQTEFFSAALDGPIKYSGLDLAAVHRGRGIKRTHVTRFVEHLLAALKEFGLSAADENAIVARVATYANDILGESTSDG